MSVGVPLRRDLDIHLAARLAGWLIWGLLTQLLHGCATGPTQGYQATAFLPLEHEPRVWYEPGGLAYAQEVSALLDKAVSRVEMVHGQPFLRPPSIRVCDSMACFRALVPTPGYTAAVIPGEILVLSPKLYLEENERLSGILVHELSHLHLGQRLGHYTMQLPVWFHEGLASLVAEGSGAEYSSDDEACASWDAGRRVDFAQPDSPGMRRRASDFKLSIHQFYRQSWRFLQYLQRRDGAAFATLLREIQAGRALTIAVISAYNASLEQLTLEFEFDSR
jgi:hypothetical protein